MPSLRLCNFQGSTCAGTVITISCQGPPSTTGPDDVEQRPQEVHPHRTYYAHCIFFHGAHEWAEPSSCLSC